MERPEIIKFVKKGDKQAASKKAGVSINVVSRWLNGYTDNGIIGVYLEEVVKARKVQMEDFAKNIVHQLN